MRKLTLSLSVLVLFGVACLGAQQLLAEKAMVATLLASPPVFVSASAFAPDAGLPADAGYTVQGETLAFVFFGERDANALDEPPAAISNATVTLRSEGVRELTLPSKGEGKYQLTGKDDAALSYKPGATYEFRATLESAVFTAEVANVPPVETIAAFHPASGFVDHPTAQPFSFERPPPAAGVERALGFVTVVPVTNEGPGRHTYTNIPDAPLELLQLVARPSNWKKDRVDIPGSAFPNAKSNYLIIFQSAKTGKPKSSNLFAGSAILAGSADVAVVRTR